MEMVIKRYAQQQQEVPNQKESGQDNKEQEEEKGIQTNTSYLLPWLTLLFIKREQQHGTLLSQLRL